MELQRYIGRELSGLKMAMDRALDSLTSQYLDQLQISCSILTFFCQKQENTV